MDNKLKEKRLPYPSYYPCRAPEKSHQSPYKDDMLQIKYKNN